MVLEKLRGSNLDCDKAIKHNPYHAMHVFRKGLVNLNYVITRSNLCYDKEIRIVSDFTTALNIKRNTTLS